MPSSIRCRPRTRRLGMNDVPAARYPRAAVVGGPMIPTVRPGSRSHLGPGQRRLRQRRHSLEACHQAPARQTRRGAEAVGRFDELVAADGFQHVPINHYHCLKGRRLCGREHRAPSTRMRRRRRPGAGRLVLVTRDPALGLFGVANVLVKGGVGASGRVRRVNERPDPGALNRCYHLSMWSFGEPSCARLAVARPRASFQNAAGGGRAWWRRWRSPGAVG